MTLCLLGIGACPSSIVILYLMHSPACQYVYTEFLTRESRGVSLAKHRGRAGPISNPDFPEVERP